MIFKHTQIFIFLLITLSITQQIQSLDIAKVVNCTKMEQNEGLKEQFKNKQTIKITNDLQVHNEQISLKNELMESFVSKLQTFFIDNQKQHNETTSQVKNERILQITEVTAINQTIIQESTVYTNNSTSAISLDQEPLSLQLKTEKQVVNPVINIADKIIQTEPSFSNIVLHHKIPSHFLLGQIFNFKGHIITRNIGITRVNVILKRMSDGFQMDFSATLKPNQTVFTIPTYLKYSGQYNLAIFTGLSGRGVHNIYTISKIMPIEFVVLPPIMVRQAFLSLKSNDLFVEWKNYQQPLPCITKLVFSQGIHQLSYIVSNFQTIFRVPYADFHEFREGIVNIQIGQAFSKSESAYDATSSFSTPFILTFNAVRHNFAKVDNSNQLKNIPMKIIVGESFVLCGRSGTALSNQVYLQTPNKQFLIFNITPNATSKVIPAQTFINITIHILQAGIYILQINDADGSAIYNAPIYSGQIYPLLPDFVDLSPKQSDLTALSYPTSLRDRRNLVLNLINKVRAQFNTSSVQLDETLNIFAQNYSEMQAAYNYIGHVDHEGSTLKERLANANITFGVSQNLALDMNLTEAQLMLQRSPAHLKNTVNPAWSRVGLGIVQNSEGYYYLTQEFSYRDMEKHPLTDIQMASIREQIINLILNKYSIIKSENTGMSSILSNYQLDSDLIAYLKNQNIFGSLMTFKIVVSYDGADYLDLIRGQLKFAITNNNFSRLGLSVSYRSGLLHIIGVITS